MRRFIGVLAILILSVSAVEAAEDNYYVLPVNRVTVTEGEIPDQIGWRHFRRIGHHIRVSLDSDGEAYLESSRDFREESRLAVRTSGELPVSGRFFFPAAEDEEAGTVVTFQIPKEINTEENARQGYLSMKRAHYRNLLSKDIPGGAWFRHRSNTSREQAGRQRPRRGRGSDLRETFALFSGGRAIRENLQLDRVLQRADEAQPPSVNIDELDGITVSEMDWEGLTEGLDPETDPLARLIPADQHAVFFSSFSDMRTLLDEARESGTPVLRLMEPRSESARSHQRYEKQLCLETSTLSRILGPQLINSVAFTGADPYLRTGADMAVLFEAREPNTLYQAVRTRQKMAAKQSDVSTVEGSIGDVNYVGARSPDRSVCSYLARAQDAIIVTNSTAQLQRIVETLGEKREALASLPEYTFFRDRYKRGASDETGFLVLTDATIRRWCSPRWRIGASRRTRMASFMADLQAQNVDHVVEGAEGNPLPDDVVPVPNPGDVTLTTSGVRSSRYGTLDFLTPIVELDIDNVSTSEAEAYRRWRDGYQRNFSQVFDPIAVRFNTKPELLGVDVTVMPLIDESDYQEMIDLTSGGEIGPNDGDPHEGTLLHFVMSIDKESEQIQRMGKFGPFQSSEFGTSPLSWLGDTLAVYVDTSPFWQEFKKSEDTRRFLQNNLSRLPVGLHVGVSSTMKLTGFLASLKGFIQQSAPGMTVWETHEHNGQRYVSIAPSREAKRQIPDSGPDEFTLYYAPSPSALIVTLDETLLHQALDRQKKRSEASGDQQNTPESRTPWLGENASLTAEKEVLNIANLLGQGSYQRAMQRRAWGNIPILNEWKRRFPDRDPVEVHQAIWGTRLVCPGGGSYVWNSEWQTMESTVYGHPAQPGSGSPLPPQVEALQSGNFGVTFENDGVRARVRLKRDQDEGKDSK